MTEKKSKPRQNKYASFVARIQDVALQGDGDNRVSVELEYQQALSIHLRSGQLIREGQLHPTVLIPERKAKQIERCYEQKGQRRY